MRYLMGAVILISLTSVAIASSSSQINAVFLKANNAYANGQYQDAATHYQSLIQNSHISGAIYYNLGNTYAKLGKKGYALLYYTRARQLDPHDEDILANIHFLQSQLSIPESTRHVSWTDHIQQLIQERIPLSIWFVLTYCVFLGICITIIYGWWTQKQAKQQWIMLGLLLLSVIILLLCYINGYRYHYRHPKGVIISQQSTVRYSPSLIGTPAFNLSEGQFVHIIRHDGSWTHVRLNKKQSGWIPTSNIEKI